MRKVPDVIGIEDMYKRVHRFQRRYIIFGISVISLIIIVLGLTFLNNSGLFGTFRKQLNDLNCQVMYLDMNNGYGIFLECEGRTALFDSGNEAHTEEIIRFLEENEVEKLEYYFVLDATEEYKSVYETILNSVEIQSVILPADKSENGMTEYFDELAFMNGRTATVLNMGRSFNVHKMHIDVVDPCSPSSFEIRFGNNSFIIWNSDDESVETEFVESLYLNEDKTYVLWLGKRAGEVKIIQEKLTPQICIVDSENVNYDVSFMEQYSEEIYVTNNGEKIVVSSNEVDLKVKCENQ